MPQQAEEPTLLASDLDGTLVPPEDSRERLEEVRRFRGAVTRGGLRLAYVTGRHLELALAGVRRFGLPLPEALGCDVGTTVYWSRNGAFEEDVEYRRLVGASPDVARSREVQGALTGVGELALQEAEKQSEFKVSYHVDGVFTPALADLVRARLRAVGSNRLVSSHDPVTGRALLDVLPETVGKRTAVEHIAVRLDPPPSGVIFAGDSGNDRDAILSGMRAVVVGNTSPQLLAELRARAEKRGLDDRVYFARHRFARGVVEGLRHFGALPGS